MLAAGVERTSMASEEERLLEAQLEAQLQEQRDSLSAIDEALVSDPTNSELLSVHEDLVLAIRDAEEGLLHLKRARLLQEVDSAIQISKVKVEPLDLKEEVKAEPLEEQSYSVGLSKCSSEDVKVEPLDPTEEVKAQPLGEQSYFVGSKCRFRHIDGHWYNGQIIGLEGSTAAKISFLVPTSESMTICKFFLQQRCRFGANCRLSHGIDVPLSTLKKFIPTPWEQSLVGSSIWAVTDRTDGIWREAELESWDDQLDTGQIVFRDDGSSSNLGIDAISLSEYAIMTDEEENSSTSEESYSSESEEDDPLGLGFLESSSSRTGVQTETTLFATWEIHTRGIASKMMANMGYREGMGLGVSGQGMLNPLSVKVLPPKQSLDHALESQGTKKNIESSGKKRSRGGKRKRDKKFAAAARAAKHAEEMEPDVFSLINSQLAMHAASLNGTSAKKQQIKDMGRKEDRRALVAYSDEVKDLKMRVEKLEEMVNRNRKEKVVYEAALRKLKETRSALAEVEAAHASASNAVVSKEKEKKWLKF